MVCIVWHCIDGSGSCIVEFGCFVVDIAGDVGGYVVVVDRAGVYIVSVGVFVGCCIMFVVIVRVI